MLLPPYRNICRWRVFPTRWKTKEITLIPSLNLNQPPPDRPPPPLPISAQPSPPLPTSAQPSPPPPCSSAPHLRRPAPPPPTFCRVIAGTGMAGAAASPAMTWAAADPVDPAADQQGGGSSRSSSRSVTPWLEQQQLLQPSLGASRSSSRSAATLAATTPGVQQYLSRSAAT